MAADEGDSEADALPEGGLFVSGQRLKSDATTV